MIYTLKKPIAEYTLRDLAVELKSLGAFYNTATSHLTEATADNLKAGQTFPIDLTGGKKLGDVKIPELVAKVTPKQLFRLKAIQSKSVEVIHEAVVQNGLEWSDD